MPAGAVARPDQFGADVTAREDAAPPMRWGRGTLLPAGPEAAVAMTAAHVTVAPRVEDVAVPTLVVH